MQVRTRVEKAEIIITDNNGKVAFKYAVENVDMQLDLKRLLEAGEQLVEQILKMK